MNSLDLPRYVFPLHIRQHSKSNGSRGRPTQMWECHLSNKIDDIDGVHGDISNEKQSYH